MTVMAELLVLRNWHFAFSASMSAALRAVTSGYGESNHIVVPIELQNTAIVCSMERGGHPAT
jgi:hypothetical protein